MYLKPLIPPILLLKKMALEQAPHGTVVLSEEQTAGRGRMGRSFTPLPVVEFI